MIPNPKIKIETSPNPPGKVFANKLSNIVSLKPFDTILYPLYQGNIVTILNIIPQNKYCIIYRILFSLNKTNIKNGKIENSLIDIATENNANTRHDIFSSIVYNSTLQLFHD